MTTFRKRGISLDVLLTGGAGFIGSNMAEDLVRQDHDVIVLDNMQTGNLENLKDINIQLIKKNCRDIPSLNIKPQIIVHLGIPSSSPMYKKNPYLTGKAINDFITILELAKREQCRVVYASTASLYNDLKTPHSEDLIIKVTDYYSETRLAMERIAELYYKLFDVRSIGCRFFSVYGPHEEFKKEYANIITQFLWSMLIGKQPIIYGDGSQSRDFIYVKDVTRALTLAMASEYHGILNIGTGRAHSFNDVIRLLIEKTGINTKPEYVKNPIKNYVNHNFANTLKAKKILGFKARYTLDEGLDELLKYYK